MRISDCKSYSTCIFIDLLEAGELATCNAHIGRYSNSAAGHFPPAADRGGVRGNARACATHPNRHSGALGSFVV